MENYPSMRIFFSKEDECYIAVVNTGEDRYTFISAHGDTPSEAAAELCVALDLLDS